MNKKKKTSRREFVKTTGAIAAGSTLAMNFGIINSVYARKDNVLKVALIGCGGRGTGAANQALNAGDDTVLVGMADAFQDRIDTSILNLKKMHENRVKVDKKTMYNGFDGYKKLIDSDVDVVLLTTPPVFRPLHLEYAVSKGKHVFAEKPMAVDAPGIRKVLESAKKAKEQNLSLVSGFCWRYHNGKRETFKRVLEGQIGEVKAVYTTYNTGELWSKPWQPEWTDMEKKMRNWLYYNWLSGDHIIEQAIHSIDMGSWAMGDMKPLKAIGTGGRQVRTDKIYGNIFDHFSIIYEYENGAKSFHICRQQKDTARAYSVEVWGTKGRAIADVIRRKHEIIGENPWRFRGEGNDMYQQEHNELFASIRDGKPMNDGEWMAQSNMMGILGRTVAYTGAEISYNDALASKEALGPDPSTYTWDLKIDGPPIALPGITKFT